MPPQPINLFVGRVRARLLMEYRIKMTPDMEQLCRLHFMNGYQYTDSIRMIREALALEK